MSFEEWIKYSDIWMLDRFEINDLQAVWNAAIDGAVKVVIQRAEPHSFEEQCLEHVVEEIKELKA